VKITCLIGWDRDHPLKPLGIRVAVIANAPSMKVEQLNREQGLGAMPGSFAENLTTRGFDTSRLAVGRDCCHSRISVL
jgi:MOSC domain-containing protein YiiM